MTGIACFASASSPLLRLPGEIQAIIAENCGDISDVINLARTCRAMYRLLSRPVTRMRFFERRFDLVLRPQRRAHRRVVEWVRRFGVGGGKQTTMELSYVGIRRALGRLDNMDWPRTDSMNFEVALGVLVNQAYSNGCSRSNNLTLLERFVANPANHRTIFGKYRQSNSGQSSSETWPLVPLFISFLHLAFQLDVRPEGILLWSEIVRLQAISYSTASPIFTVEGPVLLPVVNRDGLLKLICIASLFRCHLLYDREATDMVDCYEALDAHLRPSEWTTCIGSRSSNEAYPIPAHWKGSSASMSLSGLRHLSWLTCSGGQVFSKLDERYLSLCSETAKDFESRDGFESLHLEFPDSVLWPKDFDDMVPVIPGAAKGPPPSQQQHHHHQHQHPGAGGDDDAYRNTPNALNIPFVGRLRSNGTCFLLSGNINPVPHVAMGACRAQGFQRISFVAIPLTDERLGSLPTRRTTTMTAGGDVGSSPLVDQVNALRALDPDCYAYEGLVNPGASMVVGHYRLAFPPLTTWNADDPGLEVQRGPFVFWSVRYPGGVAEEKKIVEEIIHGP